VVVGIVAWLLLGERPTARVAAAVPIALSGVVLISGVVGADAYGERPLLGVVLAVLTAVAYAAFLLVFRHAGRDLRPPGGMLFDATAACAAALVVVGLTLDELEVVPAWPEHGWLIALALSGQVLGYLAIAVSLPRLPAVVTSILLLVQPVLSVGIAAVVVDERPSASQLVGVGLVVAAIVVAASGRATARPVPSPATS
jgi:drug/metabolite transporter (DMT)-like permease